MLLELQYANEDHVFLRRRHRDNLRLQKTHRRYAVGARQATVSRLGACLVVASYKENPRVGLVPGQSADWWDYHRAPVVCRKHGRPVPRRWHGKVLACTDATATARQVVEWYEVRWQVEIFFRELKSRMQFGCYVLQKFEAVERYLDLLLMGFLLLEQERLRELRAAGPASARGGEGAGADDGPLARAGVVVPGVECNSAGAALADGARAPLLAARPASGSPLSCRLTAQTQSGSQPMTRQEVTQIMGQNPQRHRVSGLTRR